MAFKLGLKFWKYEGCFIWKGIWYTHYKIIAGYVNWASYWGNVKRQQKIALPVLCGIYNERNQK